MLISVVAFTVNSLLLRKLSGDEHTFSPLVPLLFRSGIGLIIVFTLVHGRRPTRIRPVFTDRKLIMRGCTGLLGTAAYYVTVPTLGAGKATLFCNTYVIFAAVFAIFVLKETLTLKKLAWLVLALLGIALLSGNGGESSFLIFGLQEMIALGGAIMAAWTVVLIRQLVHDHSNGTIFLAQCIWIFIPVLPLVAKELPHLNFEENVLLVIAATAASLGQLLMNEGYRCLRVAAGASLQMAWPVFTSIGGFLLFQETYTFLQIGGAMLILLAIWRVSVVRARREERRARLGYER